MVRLSHIQSPIIMGLQGGHLKHTQIVRILIPQVEIREEIVLFKFKQILEVKELVL